MGPGEWSANSPLRWPKAKACWPILIEHVGLQQVKIVAGNAIGYGHAASAAALGIAPGRGNVKPNLLDSRPRSRPPAAQKPGFYALAEAERYPTSGGARRTRQRASHLIPQAHPGKRRWSE
jgi:hypothetical protein